MYLNDYSREAECEYKDEHYLVRDNGAVLRKARIEKRLRKWDNIWTFGNPNHNGYLQIASVVIHRIVAYAFIGAPPTPQHIVDHIDTNRQNNRPENLRWLTKLENILNNPITLKRIKFLCGSIDAFLNDPSILKEFINEDPNFKWMRTVSKIEAQRSWERLSSWAKQESNKMDPKGGSMGEWIFEENNLYSKSYQQPSDTVESKTPNCIQKDWKTPSIFPCCPTEWSESPIATYHTNLKVGKIFSSNQYLDSVIEDFAMSTDASTFWVLCKNSNDDAVKPWSLAQVSFENELFVHQSLGSFFKRDGAEKQFTLAQGLEWAGGDTFDDFT
ncbi:MAG: HNH endonuclease signature motif containing protein [Cyclobacteriaceae bacterium]